MSPEKRNPGARANASGAKNCQSTANGISPMKISLPPSFSNAPDLFSWALSQAPTPLPLPARRISERFGVPPRRAVLIAELAGFQEVRS